MTYAGHVEHELPARMRIKVAAERGDKDFFDRLAKDVSEVASVLEVQANPLTGSVTVRVDPEKGDVRSVLKSAGLFEFVDPKPKTARKSRKHRRRGKLGAHHALAAGLSGLGALQLVTGDVAGSASESFWNAFRAQTHLRRPFVAFVLGAIGLVQLARGQYLNSASALLFYSLTAKHLAREVQQIERQTEPRSRRAAPPRPRRARAEASADAR
jgi:hypothetical protein